METKKPIYFFRRLPGNMVKLTKAETKEVRYISEENFNAIRERETGIYWIEQKPDDVGQTFETESGFKFQMLRTKP